MTATAKSTQLPSQVVACKASREDVKLPGDFAFMRLDDKRVVMLACPCCGKPCLADGHTIVRDEPLTLVPVVECPSGCRYRIHEGRVIPQ